jgi:hypothetical protein
VSARAGPFTPACRCDYWIKEIRHREMDYVKRAEDAYAHMVAAWQEAPKKKKVPG